MTPAHANSHEALQEEILAGARTQADETVGRARDEGQALVDKARADADKEHQGRLDAAKTEAARRRDLILATVPVDVGRRRSAKVEALLQKIHDEARRRLLAREGFDYRETVVGLAAKAVARMAGGHFTLALSDADRRQLDDGWLEEVRRRSAKANVQVSFAAEPAKIEGGVIIRDADGRQMWDDSLAARLERLWPAMRCELAVRTGLLAAGGGEES